MSSTRSTPPSARLDLRTDAEQQAPVVDGREVTTLSDAERDRFLHLIASPPDTTSHLRSAARRHRELIVRSE